jgi:hypothetical protein
MADAILFEGYWVEECVAYIEREELVDDSSVMIERDIFTGKFKVLKLS